MVERNKDTRQMVERSRLIFAGRRDRVLYDSSLPSNSVSHRTLSRPKLRTPRGMSQAKRNWGEEIPGLPRSRKSKKRRAWLFNQGDG